MKGIVGTVLSAGVGLIGSKMQADAADDAASGAQAAELLAQERALEFEREGRDKGAHRLNVRASQAKQALIAGAEGSEAVINESFQQIVDQARNSYDAAIATLQSHYDQGLAEIETGYKEALQFAKESYGEGTELYQRAADQALAEYSDLQEQVTAIWGQRTGHVVQAFETARDRIVGEAQPYLQAGGAAAMELKKILVDGVFNDDIIKNTARYKFVASEGMKALERRQAAGGDRLGGRAVKEAMRFNQGLASTEFDKHLSNLFQLAGTGQNALNTIAGAEMGAAGGIGGAYSQEASNLAGTARQTVGQRANIFSNLGSQQAGLRQNLGNTQTSAALAKGDTRYGTKASLGQQLGSMDLGRGTAIVNALGKKGDSLVGQESGLAAGLGNLYQSDAGNYASLMSGSGARSSNIMTGSGARLAGIELGRGRDRSAEIDAGVTGLTGGIANYQQNALQQRQLDIMDAWAKNRGRSSNAFSEPADWEKFSGSSY